MFAQVGCQLLPERKALQMKAALGNYKLKVLETVTQHSLCETVSNISQLCCYELYVPKASAQCQIHVVLVVGDFTAIMDGSSGSEP